MLLEGPQHHIRDEGHNEEEEGEEPDPRGGEGVVVHPVGRVLEGNGELHLRGRRCGCHSGFETEKGT